jgi:hypothetical protein
LTADQTLSQLAAKTCSFGLANTGFAKAINTNAIKNCFIFLSLQGTD